MADVVALIRELQGGFCRCGGTKPCGRTFCGTCYHALPMANRRALWKLMGDGYEAAYADACALLDWLAWRDATATLSG